MITLRRRVLATITGAAALLALVPAAAAGHSASEQTDNEGPALAHLRAYVEAFNAGDEASMRAFFRDHLAASALEDMPVGKRLARHPATKRQLKSLAIEKVVGDLPFHGSLLVKAGNGMLLLLAGAVEKASPNKLLS
ncbi:MAG TPA: hypothetical protein ENO03_01095, partial [Candidatus Aminicenantes bacterium]|nr:hypothetical protein [Candidatus Aminicenantes bacterium]